MLDKIVDEYQDKVPYIENSFHSIHHRQIFSGGVSDQNENQVGKFFAQKKGFPNFSPAAGFFRRGGTENR